MLDILGMSKEPVARRPTQGRQPVFERTEYIYRHGEHELVLSSRKISDRMVQAVGRDDAEFVLIVEEPLLLFGARFGEVVPWAIAPYCWHDTPREARTLPPGLHGLEESRALLQVRLLDLATGQVKVERNLTLWLHFTRALHDAIREQARTPLDPRGRDRALARLRLRYATDDAIANSATIRSLGSL